MPVTLDERSQMESRVVSAKRVPLNLTAGEKYTHFSFPSLGKLYLHNSANLKLFIVTSLFTLTSVLDSVHLLKGYLYLYLIQLGLTSRVSSSSK